MQLLDTNAILRYILQDNPVMADIVEEQLYNEVCYIPVEVVAEVVYVLLRSYKIDREIVAQTLIDFIDTQDAIFFQSDVVRHALGVFASTTFDFVDCLLIGYSKEQRYSVFTFDRKLQKFLSRK
ncbi:MAG: PIN domain-containing protein [Marinilabiliaceae bacterium]|nr:PIN domain-containing protein [Marinilabiliaceae bacterium]